MRKKSVLMLGVILCLLATGCASESEAMTRDSIKMYHGCENEAWVLYDNSKTMLNVPSTQEFIQSTVQDLKPGYTYRVWLELKNPDPDDNVIYYAEGIELRVPQGAGETYKKAAGEALLATVAKELEISDDNMLAGCFLDDEPCSWEVSSAKFDYGRFYEKHAHYEKETTQ